MAADPCVRVRPTDGCAGGQRTRDRAEPGVRAGKQLGPVGPAQRSSRTSCIPTSRRSRRTQLRGYARPSDRTSTIHSSSSSSASYRLRANCSASLWARHDVLEKSGGNARVTHPIVGPPELRYETFTLNGTHGQILMVYHPEPDSASERGLALLASIVAEARPPAINPSRTQRDRPSGRAPEPAPSPVARDMLSARLALARKRVAVTSYALALSSRVRAKAAGTARGKGGPRRPRERPTSASVPGQSKRSARGACRGPADARRRRNAGRAPRRSRRA
jgi:hypothetical protein